MINHVSMNSVAFTGAPKTPDLQTDMKALKSLINITEKEIKRINPHASFQQGKTRIGEITLKDGRIIELFSTKFGNARKPKIVRIIGIKTTDNTKTEINGSNPKIKLFFEEMFPKLLKLIQEPFLNR